LTSALPLNSDFEITPDEIAPDAESRRASALRKAKWLVDFYRITADELRSVDAEDSPCTVTDPEPAPRPIKYRHPLTGDTWDGAGRHPEWLRKALLQEGYRVAELKVEMTAF